jgi:hypothetical protein
MLLTDEARLRKAQNTYQERLYAISARLNNTSPLIPNAMPLKRQIELLPRARHPLMAWGSRGIFEAVGRCNTGQGCYSYIETINKTSLQGGIER